MCNIVTVNEPRERKYGHWSGDKDPVGAFGKDTN